MKTDYARDMDLVIADLRARGASPPLLLHACCAPCSSAVLAELARDFRLTVYFDNPNMDTGEEYALRAGETRRLVRALGLDVPVIVAPWDQAAYEAAVEGVRDAPEGGARCARCFALRLARSAAYARAHGFRWFTTTLTVSPHKNAALLNQIGRDVGEAAGVPFLPSDFKKRDGYLNSIRRSREYGLYRQDYCGCIYSRRARDRRTAR